MRVKKIIYLICLISMQLVDIQAQDKSLKIADSLFSAKNYNEAAIIYENQITGPKGNKSIISLKLAYIYEQLNLVPKQLYYLNYHYNLDPSDTIFDKMHEIALENKFSGFERSDLNFILLLYQQYYFYLMYLLIAIGCILTYFLFRKYKRGQIIIVRHKILMGLYLLLLVLVVNLPSSYKSAIINTKSNFRGYPSSGSQVLGNIDIGNKVNIFGEDDIWLRVFWKGNIVYIKKNSTWLLPS